MEKLTISSWGSVRSATVTAPLRLDVVPTYDFLQTICLPVGPRCDLCELNTKGPERCPSAQKVVNPKGRKVVSMSEVVHTDSGPKVEIKIEEAVIPETSAKPTPSLEDDVSVKLEDLAED